VCSDSTTQVDLNRCDPRSKPTFTQSCPGPAQCSYGWYTGAFGACSANCGTGSQVRAVYCKCNIDNINAAVPDSYCTNAGRGQKPTTMSDCNTTPCPVYTWYCSAWGTCPADCDGGVQCRNCNCYLTTDIGYTNPVAISYCNPSTADFTMARPCNTQPCTRFYWGTDNWAPCAPQCSSTGSAGTGTMTRNLICWQYSQGVTTKVDNSRCDPTYQPTTVGTCNIPACPAYDWYYTAWCNCDKPCAGGQQTRHVVCTKTGTNNLYIVPDSQCNANTRPPTAQPCNQQACPPGRCIGWCPGYSTCYSTTWLSFGAVDVNQCNYNPYFTQNTYWNTGAWTTCSGGTQTRALQCRGNTVNGGTVALDNSQCTTTQPQLTRTC